MPTNRRHLLQIGTLTAASTSGPLPLEATGQDPHIEWMHQLQGLVAYAEETFSDSPEGRELYAAFIKRHTPPLKKLLSQTPARTVAGAVAQLHLFAEELDFFRDEREDDPYAALLFNVIDTLEQLVDPTA